MLTIAVLFMVSGGLIPFFIDMRIQLEDKKRSMHAAETAYQAAFEYNQYFTTSGEVEKDGVTYSWVREEGRLCVTYHTHNLLVESLCVES